MSYWKPEPRWENEPCYIIGGGTSLIGFDWQSLKNRNVIGCNVAFYLGADIVPITIFGDADFYHKHSSGIDTYHRDGGEIVTCCHMQSIQKFSPPDYIKVAKKKLTGLDNVDHIGWNSNTGSAAIALALLFGADPIYLLGYDMKKTDDGNNYHNFYNHIPSHNPYDRFKKGMAEMVRDFRQLYPDRSVINLEDGTSELNVFPKQSLKEHFAKVTA